MTSIWVSLTRLKAASGAPVKSTKVVPVKSVPVSVTAVPAMPLAGAIPVTAAPRGTTLGGESQVAARHGGRVVALIGNNALFHLEVDRWPEAVDVEAVARFANAFTDVALQLAQS